MLLLATATAITLPALANAAVVVVENTIGAGEFFTDTQTIMPGDTVQFTFSVEDDLFIENFSVAGTGTNATDDLANLLFGLSMPPQEGFDTFITLPGDNSAGFGSIPGATFFGGDTFTVFFSETFNRSVGVTFSFSTQAAVVPLPATGLLLAPFLAAGGFAGWRRRKAARANAV